MVKHVLQAYHFDVDGSFVGFTIMDDNMQKTNYVAIGVDTDTMTTSKEEIF